METVRLITGTILTALGLILLFTDSVKKNWGLLILVITILILGIFILINKKEDKIEQRKDLITKNNK